METEEKMKIKPHGSVVLMVEAHFPKDYICKVLAAHPALGRGEDGKDMSFSTSNISRWNSGERTQELNWHVYCMDVNPEKVRDLESEIREYFPKSSPPCAFVVGTTYNAYQPAQ
jgi:hypothetical protein